MPLQTGGAYQIDHCLPTTLILAGQASDIEAIESMSAAFVIDEQHVKTEEAEYRPSANGHGDDARDEAQASQAEHEDEEALWTKRAMRRDDRRKDYEIAHLQWVAG